MQHVNAHHSSSPPRSPTVSPFSITSCAAGLLCEKKKCKQDPSSAPSSTTTKAAGATSTAASTTSGANQGAGVCKKDEVSNGQGGCIKYRWVMRKSAPRAVGEVGNGIIGDVLYMTGAQTKSDNRELTQAYHIPSNSWLSPFALARRPFDGDHSATETYKGKLYQIGGLCWGSGGCAAEQKVQIYDPVSDTWSLGADVPYRVNGAQYSALIDGVIYTCGGLDKVPKDNTKKCAAYDIEADSWSNMPNMPDGGHHGAGCTDGTRFWLFSGRMTKTKILGSDIVQVYDPRTGSWATSEDGLIAPLPRVRSGYGQCVYLGGEFYVIGGAEGAVHSGAGGSKAEAGKGRLGVGACASRVRCHARTAGTRQQATTLRASSILPSPPPPPPPISHPIFLFRPQASKRARATGTRTASLTLSTFTTP